MKNFLKLILLVSFACIADGRPSVEQLVNSNKVKMSYELFCDDKNCDKEAWKKIVLAVNDLVNKCHAADNAPSSKEKENELFKEFIKIIEFIRNEQLKSSDSINSLTTIAVDSH